MITPNFQIETEKETQTLGSFIIEPLEQGYGNTLGNALRRVLLGSLPGAAVTQVKIGSVKHRFSTIEGVKEDVVEILLNIKQLVVKYEGEKPIKLEIEKTGPGEVKGSDIKALGNAEIINKDLVICNLADKKAKLKMEMTVERGYGYLPVEDRKSEKLGLILIDAAFSPVRRVNYRVEETRVGRRTNLDRLVIEVTTNGTIKPSEAIRESANILVGYLKQIVNPKKVEEEKVEQEMVTDEVAKLTVEELDLPTRIANALRKGGYPTVGDLHEAKMSDLTKVKNMGEKSIKVVQSALVKKGVNLKS